jgi:hypothetical protein
VNSHLVPGDEAWPADRAFLSELTPVIAQLSQYVMRYFDADAGQAKAVSVADERALAERVAGVAARLQTRAERRAILGQLPGTVEGDATQPRALEPGPDMDNGP